MQAVLNKSVMNPQSAREVFDRASLEKMGLNKDNWMGKCLTRYRTLTFYA